MAQFMPHGMCYLWKPELLWLHVVSDAVIAVSYFAIPLALLYLYQQKRHDLPFHWMFLFFAVFIVACGATHAMNIWNVWNPDYWASGAVKAVTAVASLGTAALLIPMLPRVVALKNPEELERMNDELRRREHQLAEAQAIARLGSWELDPVARSAEISRETSRILGKEPAGELRFEDLLEVIHPDDRSRVTATVERAIAGEVETYQHHYRIRTSEGERIVQGRGRVRRDADGEVQRIVGTLQDITEARRAQDELRRREQQLLEAQEIAHLGSWEWVVEQDQVQWSDELYRIYGLDPGSVDITFESYLERVHPEDRDRVARTIAEALASGSTFEFEERVVRPDGSVRVLESKGHTMVDDFGRAVRMVGTCHDVTEARRAEEARYESELRYQAVFDQAFGFIAILRPDGTVLDVNQPPLQAGGLRREDVVGRPIWEAGWWSGSSEEQRILRRSIERAVPGEVVREERPYRAAGGETRFVDRSIKPVHDPEGRVRFVIVEGRDVTELREAERSVRLLARAGDVLGASLDFEALLDRIAEMVVEDTATVCFMDLLDDGELDRAACAYADADREDILEALREHVPSLDAENHPIVQVVTEGRSLMFSRVDEEWIGDIAQDEGHATLLRRIGFESFVSVPLVARGRILGALTCTRVPEFGRAFGEDDLQLFEELGRRVGVALENARLYEALSESEEQYRRIIETANEGVWTIDADDVTAYVNDRMAEVLGYEPEEMIGRPMYDFMEDAVREEAPRNVERWKAGVAEQHEFKLRRRDGSSVWTYMSRSPLTDDAGGYVGALAMVTDITTLKETEGSLRDSEERYRFLAENSTDMITRHTVDGTCTYASPSAEEITGFTPEELAGRNLADVLGTDQNADGMREERLEEVLASTGPKVITGRIHRKDGRARWVEATYRAIRDEESGEIEGLLAITRDVSDRVRETRLVRLLQRITANANEAMSANAAIRASLREIAEFMEWPLAHAWIAPEDDPERLVPTGIWHEANPGEEYTAFQRATESATFVKGEILPGKTMETKGAEWIADVQEAPDFRRIYGLEEPGVVAAFALPVITRGRTLAVLEFYHNRSAVPEERLLDILADAGHQLGQVILRQRAEEALLERESQLEQAQRLAKLGSWEYDVQTDRATWSRELYRVFGLEPGAEVSFDTMLDLVHPEDKDRFREKVEETIEKRDSYTLDHRIIRPDGEVRALHAEARVERDHGDPVRLIGTTQDITERKVIEERLRKSEENYRMLAEYASDLILRFTPEGIITYASPAVEWMVGYSADEIVGEHAADFIHAEDLDQVAETHHALLKEEESRSVLFRLRGREGDLLWVESTSRAVRDAQSDWVRSIVAICRDVTENVEAARTVRLLERVAGLANQAETTQEAMRRALKLVCEYADWPIAHAYVPRRDASGATAPLHLWHIDDPERFAGFRDRTGSLAMAAAEGVPGKVLESGQPVWVENVADGGDFPPLDDLDDLGVRAVMGFPVKSGGETLAVLEFFSSEVEEMDEQILDTMRQVGGNLGQVVRRQRAEAARRASEERFRALAESASDAIVTTNEDGIIVYCNETVTRIFGYRGEDLVGRPLVTLMPERYRERHREGFERFIRTREPQVIGTPIELVGLRKDGTEIPVELSLGWWESDQGLFFTGVLRDITERKRVEEALNEKMEELARSNAELALFTYIASHDLREPLRTVGSNVQLVARRLGEEIEDANLQKSIDFALGGVRRMQDLIDDLLVYSRVGTEGKPFERIDGEAVVDEAVANLKTTIDETGVRLVRESDLPRIHGDRSQLVQLLQNLLSNAIKYRRQGVEPEIRVRAKRVGEEWEFAVEDNGIGIPAEFSDHVFTIFQRLHKEREIPGTGIGLAVCRKIVERHGGRIWVESEPGEGSTFKFTLPAR